MKRQRIEDSPIIELEVHHGEPMVIAARLADGSKVALSLRELAASGSVQAQRALAAFDAGRYTVMP